MSAPDWIRELERILGPVGLGWLAPLLRLPFDLSDYLRKRKADRLKREDSERRKHSEESRIGVATIDDVRRYDHHYKQLRNKIDPRSLQIIFAFVVQKLSELLGRGRPPGAPTTGSSDDRP